MKKYLIGSLVGGIILFVWQAASWMLLPIHKNAMSYTPAQNELLNSISSNLSEEGAYMLPCAKPDATQAEHMELGKQMEGKPWATVIYHKAFKQNIAMRMIRGFLVDFFLALSLIYVLTRGATPIPRRVLAGSVAVGLITFLWTHYMGRVWYDLPLQMVMPEFIDAIVAWGLCGAWLGWWLNRPGNTTAPVSV